MDLNQKELDILLAAIKLERYFHYELRDASGYYNVATSIAKFKRLGLIEKIAGKLQATEKGKIAAAIAIGKARKKRKSK